MTQPLYLIPNDVFITNNDIKYAITNIVIKYAITNDVINKKMRIISCFKTRLCNSSLMFLDIKWFCFRDISPQHLVKVFGFTTCFPIAYQWFLLLSSANIKRKQIMTKLSPSLLLLLLLVKLLSHYPCIVSRSDWPCLDIHLLSAPSFPDNLCPLL